MVRHALKGTRTATGFIGLKAVIELMVRDHQRSLRTLEFQVDPGSNITTIPVATARHVLLEVPAKSVEIQVNTAAGNVRQHVHAAALGLAGVIQDLRIIFDGTYALEARYGWLVLEELTPATAR